MLKGRPIAGGADGSLLNGGERSQPPSVGVGCLLIIIREVGEFNEKEIVLTFLLKLLVFYPSIQVWFYKINL